MCVHINQPFSFEPVVFFITITAAVIEPALWRGCAVYLHLGGQEECNWLTMIMLWLIRPWATAEYLVLIRLSSVESHVAHKQKGQDIGQEEKASNQHMLVETGYLLKAGSIGLPHFMLRFPTRYDDVIAAFVTAAVNKNNLN